MLPLCLDVLVVILYDVDVNISSIKICMLSLCKCINVDHLDSYINFAGIINEIKNTILFLEAV